MSSINPSTDKSSLNSAGLKPEVTRSLPERPPRPEEEGILAAIKQLYSCSPTEATFNIYSNDAVFHDPIGIATGANSIRDQFVGLAKLFPRADIEKFRVLENPSTVTPNTTLIDQDVAYFRNADSKTPTKVINSLLTLQRDEATNKVVSHNEDWNHTRTSTKEDGVFGWMNEQRKRMTANIVDALVGHGSKN